MALGRNPTLAQAAAQIAAAQGRHVQAGLYPNPVAGYMGSEMGNSGRAGQQGGFVSQEVVTAGKRNSAAVWSPKRFGKQNMPGRHSGNGC